MRRCGADIIISSVDANTLTDGSPLSRRVLFQALSDPEVAAATPFYLAKVDWTRDGRIDGQPERLCPAGRGDALCRAGYRRLAARACLARQRPDRPAHTGRGSRGPGGHDPRQPPALRGERAHHHRDRQLRPGRRVFGGWRDGRVGSDLSAAVPVDASQARPTHVLVDVLPGGGCPRPSPHGLSAAVWQAKPSRSAPWRPPRRQTCPTRPRSGRPA